MNPLADRTTADLNNIVSHTDAVFGELAAELDNEAPVADALRVLIESETTTEDFVVLMTAQPAIGQKALMMALSALVNVHSRVTVLDEIQRRKRTSDTD